MYSVVTVQWPIVDIISVLTGHYRDTELYPTSTSELWTFWVLKAVWTMFHLVIPIALHGWFGMGCLGLGLVLSSYLFALQFAVTHISDDAIFVKETVSVSEPVGKSPWAIFSATRRRMGQSGSICMSRVMHRRNIQEQTHRQTRTSCVHKFTRSHIHT